MRLKTLYQPIVAAVLLCHHVVAAPTFDGMEQEWSNFDYSLGEQYAASYGELARSEMKRTDVPASITLAQGILESDYGRSELAQHANNHFGVKCHKGWRGETYVKMTEEVRNGVLLVESAAFRLYATVEESYRDHSDCLASRSNYVSLFLQNSYDYKVWAKGLQEAGYATDKNYANKIIAIIEKYNLQQFDQLDIVDKYTPNTVAADAANIESLKKAIQTLETVLYEAEMYKEELEERLDDKNQTLNDLIVKQEAFQEKVQSEIEVLASNLSAQQALIGEVQNRLQTVEDAQRSMNTDPWADQFNSDGTAKQTTEIFPTRNLNSAGFFYQSGRKVTIAQADRNLLEIAVEYDIEFKDLLDYNDLDDDADLPTGYYVYLEPKANYVEEKVSTHQVAIGETIHTISQRYGIKAAKLYQRNHIRKGEEPKIGEYIFLNKSSKEKPAVHHTGINGTNFGAGGANR